MSVDFRIEREAAHNGGVEVCKFINNIYLVVVDDGDRGSTQYYIMSYKRLEYLYIFISKFWNQFPGDTKG